MGKAGSDVGVVIQVARGKRAWLSMAEAVVRVWWRIGGSSGGGLVSGWVVGGVEGGVPPRRQLAHQCKRRGAVGGRLWSRRVVVAELWIGLFL